MYRYRRIGKNGCASDLITKNTHDLLPNLPNRLKEAAAIPQNIPLSVCLYERSNLGNHKS